ncbi:MAG TPA: cysteine hydrolase [Deltaproteobacteria bacterium]|nr:cysteine hydrolase [Deltaproteobacteria bacterium]
MKPHSLAGTAGAEIIEELNQENGDLWIPKPRFSAFFNTSLDQWLRERSVSLCAVDGIATHFCILVTVLDSISSDFKTLLLEGCCAAPSKDVHEQTLGLFRHNALYPLLRVATSNELLSELIG